MQGIIARRVFSGRNFLQGTKRCFFSQLAQKDSNVFIHENDISIPKMPPFDYSPPPYNGPTVDEILAKRKAYLSPSLLHFYKKPVIPVFCFRLTIMHWLWFWFWLLLLLLISFSYVCMNWHIAERGGWEEAVLVRRWRPAIFGRFWRDRYRRLRPLPPRCGRRHRQPNQTLATLNRPLS